MSIFTDDSFYLEYKKGDIFYNKKIIFHTVLNSVYLDNDLFPAHDDLYHIYFLLEILKTFFQLKGDITSNDFLHGGMIVRNRSFTKFVSITKKSTILQATLNFNKDDLDSKVTVNLLTKTF